MVINSQFKDYYDFVAKQFGGGDPRIVYSRQRIVPLDPKRLWDYIQVESNCPLYDPSHFKDTCFWNRDKKPDMDYMYLVVAGKAYLLARPVSPYVSKYDVSTYKIIDRTDEKVPRWIRQRNELVFGKEYPHLEELCKIVGAPVFAIAGVEHRIRSGQTYYVSKVTICGQCPILSRLGMPARIDAYQMYQDIAMFVGNKMKKTPDTQPPVELDNKQKILKAGFDLKQSFRHRT